MKKNYVTPMAEKIEFDYSQQVVASGGHGANCFPIATGVGSNNQGNDFSCVGGVHWTN